MSSLLGVSQILTLLDRLKSVVEDFAAREEKLNAEFRAKSTAATRAYDMAAKEAGLHGTVALADAESAIEAERDQRLSRFERRKTKINEAHKTTRKRAMEKIAEHEGRKKNKLQQNALEAERRRDADLVAAAAQLKEFKQKLAESADSFSGLEFEAQKAFGAYGRFRKQLSHDLQWPEPLVAGDHTQVLDQLYQQHARTTEAIAGFRKIFITRLAAFLPAWLLLLLLVVCVGLIPLLPQLGIHSVPPRALGIGAGGLLLLLGLRQYGSSQGFAAAKAIAADLAKARRLHELAFEMSDVHHHKAQAQIRADFASATERLDQEWKRTLKEAIDMRDQRPRQIDEQAREVAQRHDQLHRARLERIESLRSETLTGFRRGEDAKAKQMAADQAANLAALQTTHEAQWQALVSEWKTSIDPIFAALREVNTEAGKLFPEWDLKRWENWQPPVKFQNAAKFGQLEVDLTKLADATPKDPRLPFPGPVNFSVPLALTYPNEGSILFETSKSGEDQAVEAMNNIIFRLLSTTPPGKLSFTIFDPVGLGQNFAGIMHLADFEESHINSRIWTQTSQLEEKLADLNDHMEKVIQMYLRNEYETIAEYNAQAGTIAEKYHILVIASFPVNFSDTAARRLRNIASSGARCGVYTLVHWDHRHTVPNEFVPDELRKNSVDLVRGEQAFEFAGRRMPGARVVLDPLPSPEFVTHFLHQVGESGKDSNRVEVPFEQVAPPPGKLWTEETTEELRVPIGRSGATKLQILAIGKGTRQHALIAGKTGSGKSTLFHVIVTNLALWCSPEQVEFYLVDFKKGVEFKCYASRNLPHARVVAIESDRQFGLSVLERVDEELRRRGDLFRKLGVQDVPGYKRAGGTESIPRSLLMIDEFQEFFVEEDRISQSAAVLLDRIVRQGRAFGIHVLLGSQTLGGAYTLARATIGQMVIRIALQCNEADAYLIMDQDNPAPRLLSRPGEGIYNDSAGSIEGNSPFQAVWLPDQVRDRYLATVRALADEAPKRYPGPFVFEGNAPADVRENHLLSALLKADTVIRPAAGRIWLGSPNSIKGPTEVMFQRQSANNLLVVGQNEEASLAILAVALISLAVEYPVGTVHIVLLESTTPGSPQRDFLDRIISAIPHPMLQARNTDLTGIMKTLGEDLKKGTTAQASEQAETTFVFIHGLQNFKKLRQEDDFSFSSNPENGVQPAAVLLDLINEGPGHGFHVIATCDTYNNVTRFLGRKTISEFAMRVLFQMSASDSASLIDNPDAGTLGLNRALLYNDREGYLETFRPYARPGNDWIEEATSRLQKLRDASTP